MKNLVNFINNKILKNKKLLTICAVFAFLFLCLPTTAHADPNSMAGLGQLYILLICGFVSFCSLLALGVNMFIKNQVLFFIIALLNSILSIFIFNSLEIIKAIIRIPIDGLSSLFSDFSIEQIPLIFCLIGIIVPLFFIKNIAFKMIPLFFVLIAIIYGINDASFTLWQVQIHSKEIEVKKSIENKKYDKLKKLVLEGEGYYALSYALSTNNKEVFDMVLPIASKDDRNYLLNDLIHIELFHIEGDKKEITELARDVIAAGVNVNLKKYLSGRLDTTPLLSAVRLGNKEIAEILIENGAEINVIECGGRTPLDFAEDEEMKQMLISHGAKSGKDLK